MLQPALTRFHGFGSRLAVAGALLVAPLSQALAGQSLPRNTVFKSEGGETWIVSIKPAGRSVSRPATSLAVPPPVDILPVVAQVEDGPVQVDVPPATLPPAPENIPDPSAAVQTAHGVTIVPDARSTTELLGRRYAEAYRAIPFNRAEYDANPSYRHDAAMELVFGQLRPTTIVRNQGPPAVDEPVSTPYQPFLPAYGDLAPWQTGRFRNPVFDPPIAPQGCYWPAY